MPRPKRPKLALSASAAPMRVANSKQRNPRQLELSSTTPSDHVQTNSDDSEGLVTTRKMKRGERVSAQEATMSGALAEGDPAPARPRPLGGRKRQLRSKIVRDADGDRAIEALKARMDAASAAERGEHRPIESTVADKSPVRGRATVRAEEKNPLTDVVSKRIIEATPRRAPSVLEASNFKRRPRQPSLLRIIQAQANHQSEDEDDSDNFEPDDASTPFLKSVSQSRPFTSPSSPAVQSAQTSSSKKRKRISPEVHVPMSSPVETVAVASPSRSLTSEPEPEEEEIHTIPSSNPNPDPEPALPFLRHQPINCSPPILDSDTLAPPLSSSPAPSPLPKVAKFKPISGNPPSSPSPPPSLQPTRSRELKPLSTASLQNLLPRRRLRFNPPRHGDAFDLPDSSELEIDMSGLGEDEDELTVHTKVHLKGRNRDRRPETEAWVAGTGKGTKKTQRQRKEKEKEKENATARKTYTRQKAPAAGAAFDENDNENENHDEEDDDDDVEARLALASTTRAKAGGGAGAKIGIGGSATTSELKRLAIKFQEVDEWKLDIEEVTGSGSSQKDAR